MKAGVKSVENDVDAPEDVHAEALGTVADHAAALAAAPRLVTFQVASDASSLESSSLVSRCAGLDRGGCAALLPLTVLASSDRSLARFSIHLIRITSSNDDDDDDHDDSEDVSDKTESDFRRPSLSRDPAAVKGKGVTGEDGVGRLLEHVLDLFGIDLFACSLFKGQGTLCR